MNETERHKCPSCTDGKIITTSLWHDGYNTITVFTPCSNTDCKSKQPTDEEKDLADAIEKLPDRERRVFALLTTEYLDGLYDAGVDVSYLPISAKIFTAKFAKRVIEDIG